MSGIIENDFKTITYDECHTLWEDENTKVHKDTSDRIIREVSEHISSRCEFNSNDIVLNIGCGDGLFDAPISDKVKKLIGIDWSLQKLSIARKKVGGY